MITAEATRWGHAGGREGGQDLYSFRNVDRAPAARTQSRFEISEMTEVSGCQVCSAELPASATRPFWYCSKACRRLANYEIERITKRLLRLEVHIDGLREKLLIEDPDKPRRPNYVARHLTKQIAAAEQVRKDTEMRLLVLLQGSELVVDERTARLADH